MQWIKSYKIEQPTLCERLINGFDIAKELGFAPAGVSAKGVDKAAGGVMVAKRLTLSHAAKVIETGDVVLSVDGVPVGEAG